MRILMVTPELPEPGRPGTMAPVRRQIASIRALGHAVDVLEIRGLKGLKYLQCWPALLARSRSAELIHAHFGYCGLLARAQLGRPIVVSFMGDDLLGTPDTSGRSTPLSRVMVAADVGLARLVDAVIVKSAEMAGVVAAIPAQVIPNGVDVEQFRPLERRAARAALGWAEEGRSVLFGGRPEEPRKDFPLARAAVAEAARILAQPIELVPLRGVVPDEVPRYMNACDAMIFTSLWEGSPNVVKEAMACTLPVVAVPVGDVETLLDGVERCLIRPRDPLALGAALAELVAGGQRTNGHTALLDKGLDQASVARRVVEVYEQVLSRGRSWRGVSIRPAAGRLE